ncbi:hypothetical protein MYX04_01310 [Nitrospiraceae bacterium AH_259_D15_M11_P09]|nr:hypothetical protein [Nitrospiraceae bacterium AH_259_D15_M11_P09]
MSERPEERSDWLHVAEEAVRCAGKFLVHARTYEPKIVAELERDVKLAADRESEERIIHVLRQKSNFTILSEEHGTNRGVDPCPELRWIVDPLDGSVNYLKGIPLCCASVGLWREEEPLLGAIYDFNRGELFTGIVGVGAWLNGMSIRVSSTSKRDQALLCTGFPVSTDFSCDSLGRFVEQVREHKKIRLFGSGALSLAYVAAGRADAYYERNIKLWDVAAGLAIVGGGGGRVVRVASDIPHALTVYADNGFLPRPCF